MKTKHTAGPWILKIGLIWSETNEGIIVCDPYDGQLPNTKLMPIDEREANAKLIAAAPELLYALEEMIHYAGYALDILYGNQANQAEKAIKNAQNILKKTTE